MMRVGKQDLEWSTLLGPCYMSKCFERNVLRVCKKHPALERTYDASERVETAEQPKKRVKLTLDAAGIRIAPGSVSRLL